MGQEDHEEIPDSPRTLDPGLDSGPDLVYLHLTGPHCAPDMDEQPSQEEEEKPGTKPSEEEKEEEEEKPGTKPSEEEEEEEKSWTKPSEEEEKPGTKPSGEEDKPGTKPSEEEGEDETGDRVEQSEAEKPAEQGEHCKNESGQNHSKITHQPLCRTQCVDLGAEGPPDLPFIPENTPQSHGQILPGDGSKELQAKLDFALKLGYSEEVVRAVLTKLGPDTLINDVLMELVRLGSREPEQGPVSGLGTGPGASLGLSGSCGCVDESRAESPAPSDSLCDQENLRPIVVDGSNVAMSHGNKEVFSCQGIQLAVDWFLERGHHDITVFVPAWRKEQSRPDAPITDQEILRRLEKQKVLVFTPSRRVQGRRVVCYDDRFIVKLAFESDGIIVSNDNYRDLANEKPEWKRFIDERLLMYSFVNDKFMPPDDPLGRHGPSLDNFLRKRPIIPEQKKQPCPYGKKCTYGHKCKYYHPERGAQPQRAVADELRASARTGPKAQTKAQTKTQTDLVKSHSVPTAEAQRSGPKRQSDPSVRALSYSEAEERLLKNLSNSTLQNSGSRTMSPAPGGPPTATSSLPLDGLSKSGTPHGHHPPDPPYPLCHSPDYYCVTHAYSNLSLSSRPSPDPRPSLDPRLSQEEDYRLDPRPSLDPRTNPDPRPPQEYDYRLEVRPNLDPRPSPDCRLPQEQDYRLDLRPPQDQDYRMGLRHSPDPRASQDIRPPQDQDYRLEIRPGLDLRPLQDQDYRLGSLGSMGSAGSECGSESSSCDSCPPDSLMDDLHFPHARFYAPPSAPHDFCEYPYPSPKRPLYPLPPHMHHPPLSARSSCPGDYHHSPLPTPGSPLARSLADSASDSRLYDHFTHSHPPPHPPHPHYPRPKVLPHWETYYRPPLAASRYEALSCYWDSYGSPTHYPPPRSPSYPLSPYPPVPPRSDSPARARHSDVREKVYINLCNIFPAELVGRVMSQSPHVTDPQQLAAAILAEKAQSGY